MHTQALNYSFPSEWMKDQSRLGSKMCTHKVLGFCYIAKTKRHKKETTGNLTNQSQLWSSKNSWPPRRPGGGGVRSTNWHAKNTT